MSNLQKLQESIANPAFQARHKALKKEIDIAIQIKQKRLALNLTQAELAQKMGVAQTVISRIESLDGGITTSTLNKFCQATNTHLEFHDLLESESLKKKVGLFEIANYILERGESILGDNFDISNLKINKLLFFIERTIFEHIGHRLFHFRVEAWDHGPVYPELYHKYKSFGRDTIKEPLMNSKLPADIEDLINNALDKYIEYSATELESLSHNDPLWKTAKEKGRNQPINFE